MLHKSEFRKCKGEARQSLLDKAKKRKVNVLRVPVSFQLGNGNAYSKNAKEIRDEVGDEKGVNKPGKVEHIKSGRVYHCLMAGEARETLLIRSL